MQVPKDDDICFFYTITDKEQYGLSDIPKEGDIIQILGEEYSVVQLFGKPIKVPKIVEDYSLKNVWMINLQCEKI